MQLLAVVLVVSRPLGLHVLIDVATLCVFNPRLQFVQIDEAILVGVNLLDDHTIVGQVHEMGQNMIKYILC